MKGISEKPRYSQKTDIPQYTPTGAKPDISELIDERKANELLTDIMCSNVNQEERSFLMKATYRHFAFNYRKIAEYYASASKEMQRLMEKSALVIIDYDDAIKNGYARLSKRIKELSEADA